MADKIAAVPAQIRINSIVKKQANKLFNELGIDISTAVNIFLRQCIMRDGLPFSVSVPQYSQELLKAVEVKKISLVIPT